MSEDLKILKLCQRIAETFDNDKAINEFGEFLQKNPQFIDSIQDAIETLQEEQEILEEFEWLKRYDLPQQKISQQGFENFVDDVLSKNYKETPNIVKLGNINEELTKALGLSRAYVFLTRKRLGHIRMQRKDKQALAINEIKMIPKIIEAAYEAYINTEKRNFTLSFNDERDATKINLLHLNTDGLGNYIVTVKKMDLRHFLNINYPKITTRATAGIEPAIHSDEAIHFTKSRGIVAQVDEIIPQNSLTSQVNQVNFPNDCGAAFRSIKEIETKRQENLKVMSDMLNKRKEQESNITQTTQLPSVDGADIDTNTSPRGPKR